MISPGIIASIRDINGPEARQYSERDTVYMSPTGKDGFLGHTPDFPVKTFGAATKILAAIKQRSEKKLRFVKLKNGEYIVDAYNGLYLTREDNSIYDDVLSIQPYDTNGDVTITGSYITITDIELTDHGLYRVELPYKVTYPNATYISMITKTITVVGEEFSTWVGQWITAEDYDHINSLRDRNGDISMYFEFVPAGSQSAFYNLFGDTSILNEEKDGYVFTNGIVNLTEEEINNFDFDVYETWFYPFTFDLTEGESITIGTYNDIVRYNPENAVYFLYTPGEPINEQTFHTFNYSTGYYINDRRLVAARFPKKGSYSYSSYPTSNPGTGKQSSWYKTFLIKDTTQFLRSLIIDETSSYSTGNPCIAYNVDYNGSPNVNTRVVGLSDCGSNMFSLSTSAPVPTGLQIFGCDLNNPKTDLSNTAHNLCTEEGEFVVSKENDRYYVYFNPYINTSIDNLVFKIDTTSLTSSFKRGFYLSGADNIKIHNIKFKHLDTGIQSNSYSRNITISGCRFEKLNNALRLQLVSNLLFYKNIIFDTHQSGILGTLLSGAKITNNIIKYNGVVRTANAESIGLNSGGWQTRSNSAITQLVSATSHTFSMNLTAITPPPDNTRINAFNNNWSGYIEILTGDFAGQKRIVNNWVERGPGANELVTPVVGFYTYSIVDPWTPVNGKLAPDPGDSAQYKTFIDSNGYNHGNRGVNNVVDHNFVKYSGAYCMQTNFNLYNTISGNYFGNASYGYSGDLGVVYMASVSSNLTNNIIENGRRGPGRYNGFALYLDYNHNRINVEKNIISTSDQVFFGHNSVNITLKNNIIKGSRGTLLNFQHTGSQFRINNKPDDFQFKAHRNIFITSSSIDYLHYRQNTIPIPVNDYKGFQGYSVYNPAHRIVHEHLTAPNDEYRSFTIYSNASSVFLNGYHHGSCFHRCGTRNGYPAYVHSEDMHAFYVKDGNWVLGYIWAASNSVSISSTASPEAYKYPWLAPTMGWFRSSTKTNFDLRFIISDVVNKRNVPLFHTHDNIHYTDVLNYNRSITPSLSTNFYAWRGGISPFWDNIYPSLCSRTLIGGNSIPSYAETDTFWNGVSGTNLYPVSAGFERLVPWEENSIFADPKLDPETYQLAPDSPALEKGFEQIDTASIGLLKDDPEWLQLAEELEARPFFGDGDFAEYKYGNHNDPWTITTFNSFSDLRALIPTSKYYKKDTITRLENTVEVLGEYGGIFQFKYDNVTPDDGVNIIKPTNSGLSNYRWKRISEPRPAYFATVPGIEFIPVDEYQYTDLYDAPLIAFDLLDEDYRPITYSPNPITLQNMFLEEGSNLNYIPLDYWLKDAVVSSFEILENKFDDRSYTFAYNGRDALSSININNSPFKSLTFTLAPTSDSRWTPEQLNGTEIPFLGTNKLNITNNANLTSVDIELNMFERSYYQPEFVRHQISLVNNNQLSSIYIKTNNTYAHFIDTPSNIGYYDIILSGCSVENFVLTAFDSTNYKSHNFVLFITTLEDSSKLKTLSIDIKDASLTYITLSTANFIQIATDILSAGPKSDVEYIDYNSWYNLRGGTPVTQNTLSSYKQLDFTNFEAESLKTLFSKNPTVNGGTRFLNFTLAPSSTIVDIITSTTYGIQWLFSGSIPVEVFFKFNKQQDLSRTVEFDVVPTNPHTLYSYQHKLAFDPLSGARQPYTFYRPVSALRKINNNFGLNKNDTYTWPLSVLNNISRMAVYQGPFADSTMPRTLIHPRYAVTADHWGHAKTYPHTFSVFNTKTQTTTTVTAITGKRIGSTDIRVIQLQTPLDADTFPGMYLIPTTLFNENSATKIPPAMPGFVFSQDYDITPKVLDFSPIGSPPGNNGVTGLKHITKDIGALLSNKIIRTGESGHPVFTFINNKPVLMHTWYNSSSGPSLSYYYNDILSVINQLDIAAGGSGNVTLNNITQADLDVYDNYDNYLG